MTLESGAFSKIEGFPIKQNIPVKHSFKKHRIGEVDDENDDFPLDSINRLEKDPSFRK